jgi:hypothetical protein
MRPSAAGPTNPAGWRKRLLAGFALEHHAAGQHHGDRVGFQLFARLLAVLRVQVGRLVLGLEVVREGDALFADGGQLGAALGDDLVFVGRGCLFLKIRSHGLYFC